jgi:hypothetical protein
MFPLHFAFNAQSYSVGPAPLHKVFKTGIIGRKFNVKLLYRVFLFFRDYLPAVHRVSPLSAVITAWSILRRLSNTAASLGEGARKLSISDDIRLVLGKWMDEETPLNALALFAHSQFGFKGCRVTSLTEESFKLTSPHRESQLIFKLPGVLFGYAQAREVEEFKETLSAEALESSGVVFRFGPDWEGRLVIAEILAPH